MLAMLRGVRFPSTQTCGLHTTCIFILTAVETIGAVGAVVLSFFMELGRRVQFITHEKRPFSFFSIPIVVVQIKFYSWRFFIRFYYDVTRWSAHS